MGEVGAASPAILSKPKKSRRKRLTPVSQSNLIEDEDESGLGYPDVAVGRLRLRPTGAAEEEERDDSGVGTGQNSVVTPRLDPTKRKKKGRRKRLTPIVSADIGNEEEDTGFGFHDIVSVPAEREKKVEENRAGVEDGAAASPIASDDTENKSGSTSMPGSCTKRSGKVHWQRLLPNSPSQIIHERDGTGLGFNAFVSAPVEIDKKKEAASNSVGSDSAVAPELHSKSHEEENSSHRSKKKADRPGLAPPFQLEAASDEEADSDSDSDLEMNHFCNRWQTEEAEDKTGGNICIGSFW